MTKPDAKLRKGELREFLDSKLPAYMTPSHFILLDEFPLTINGKVDRKALPAPESMDTEPLDATVLPRNPLEALIADIWAELLGRKAVGIYENFFIWEAILCWPPKSFPESPARFNWSFR